MEIGDISSQFVDLLKSLFYCSPILSLKFYYLIKTLNFLSLALVFSYLLILAYLAPIYWIDDQNSLIIFILEKIFMKGINNIENVSEMI